MLAVQLLLLDRRLLAQDVGLVAGLLDRLVEREQRRLVRGDLLRELLVLLGGVELRRSSRRACP